MRDPPTTWERRPTSVSEVKRTDVVLGKHQHIAEQHMVARDSLLAQASGLSLSTVKRMEEQLDATAQQSRQKAVETLRKAGIRFSRLDGGVIGIGLRESTPS